MSILSIFRPEDLTALFKGADAAAGITNAQVQTVKALTDLMGEQQTGEFLAAVIDGRHEDWIENAVKSDELSSKADEINTLYKSNEVGRLIRGMNRQAAFIQKASTTADEIVAKISAGDITNEDIMPLINKFYVDNGIVLNSNSPADAWFRRILSRKLEALDDAAPVADDVAEEAAEAAPIKARTPHGQLGLRPEPSGGNLLPTPTKTWLHYLVGTSNPYVWLMSRFPKTSIPAKWIPPELSFGAYIDPYINKVDDILIGADEAIDVNAAEIFADLKSQLDAVTERIGTGTNSLSAEEAAQESARIVEEFLNNNNEALGKLYDTLGPVADEVRLERDLASLTRKVAEKINTGKKANVDRVEAQAEQLISDYEALSGRAYANKERRIQSVLDGGGQAFRLMDKESQGMLNDIQRLQEAVETLRDPNFSSDYAQALNNATSEGSNNDVFRALISQRFRYLFEETADARLRSVPQNRRASNSVLWRRADAALEEVNKKRIRIRRGYINTAERIVPVQHTEDLHNTENSIIRLELFDPNDANKAESVWGIVTEGYDLAWDHETVEAVLRLNAMSGPGSKHELLDAVKSRATKHITDLRRMNPPDQHQINYYTAIQEAATIKHSNERWAQRAVHEFWTKISHDWRHARKFVGPNALRSTPGRHAFGENQMINIPLRFVSWILGGKFKPKDLETGEALPHLARLGLWETGADAKHLRQAAFRIPKMIGRIAAIPLMPGKWTLELALIKQPVLRDIMMVSSGLGVGAVLISEAAEGIVTGIWGEDTWITDENGNFDFFFGSSRNLGSYGTGLAIGIGEAILYPTRKGIAFYDSIIPEERLFGDVELERLASFDRGPINLDAVNRALLGDTTPRQNNNTNATPRRSTASHISTSAFTTPAGAVITDLDSSVLQGLRGTYPYTDLYFTHNRAAGVPTAVTSTMTDAEKARVEREDKFAEVATDRQERFDAISAYLTNVTDENGQLIFDPNSADYQDTLKRAAFNMTIDENITLTKNGEVKIKGAKKAELAGAFQVLHDWSRYDTRRESLTYIDALIADRSDQLENAREEEGILNQRIAQAQTDEQRDDFEDQLKGKGDYKNRGVEDLREALDTEVRSLKIHKQRLIIEQSLEQNFPALLAVAGAEYGDAYNSITDQQKKSIRLRTRTIMNEFLSRDTDGGDIEPEKNFSEDGYITHALRVAMDEIYNAEKDDFSASPANASTRDARRVIDMAYLDVLAGTTAVYGTQRRREDLAEIDALIAEHEARLPFVETRRAQTKTVETPRLSIEGERKAENHYNAIKDGILVLKLHKQELFIDQHIAVLESLPAGQRPDDTTIARTRVILGRFLDTNSNNRREAPTASFSLESFRENALALALTEPDNTEKGEYSRDQIASYYERAIAGIVSTPVSQDRVTELTEKIADAEARLGPAQTLYQEAVARNRAVKNTESSTREEKRRAQDAEDHAESEAQKIRDEIRRLKIEREETRIAVAIKDMGPEHDVTEISSIMAAFLDLNTDNRKDSPTVDFSNPAFLLEAQKLSKDADPDLNTGAFNKRNQIKPAYERAIAASIIATVETDNATTDTATQQKINATLQSFLKDGVDITHPAALAQARAFIAHPNAEFKADGSPKKNNAYKHYMRRAKDGIEEIVAAPVKPVKSGGRTGGRNRYSRTFGRASYSGGGPFMGAAGTVWENTAGWLMGKENARATGVMTRESIYGIGRWVSHALSGRIEGGEKLLAGGAAFLALFLANPLKNLLGPLGRIPLVWEATLFLGVGAFAYHFFAQQSNTGGRYTPNFLKEVNSGSFKVSSIGQDGETAKFASVSTDETDGEGSTESAGGRSVSTAAAVQTGARTIRVNDTALVNGAFASSGDNGFAPSEIRDQMRADVRMDVLRNNEVTVERLAAENTALGLTPGLNTDPRANA